MDNGVLMLQFVALMIIVIIISAVVGAWLIANFLSRPPTNLYSSNKLDNKVTRCPECQSELDLCAAGHLMCMECGWQTEGCDWPKNEVTK